MLKSSFYKTLTQLATIIVVVVILIIPAIHGGGY